MHGPPLTIAEIADLLARQVSQLVGLGTTRLRAIEAVSARHGIEPTVVDRLVAPHAAPNSRAVS